MLQFRNKHCFEEKNGPLFLEQKHKAEDIEKYSTLQLWVLRNCKLSFINTVTFQVYVWYNHSHGYILSALFMYMALYIDELWTKVLTASSLYMSK